MAAILPAGGRLVSGGRIVPVRAPGRAPSVSALPNVPETLRHADR
jgi:hypothetical protein